MSRSDALRSTLDRCRQEADYCEREFREFARATSPGERRHCLSAATLEGAAVLRIGIVPTRQGRL